MPTGWNRARRSVREFLATWITSTNLTVTWATVTLGLLIVGVGVLGGILSFVAVVLGVANTDDCSAAPFVAPCLIIVGAIGIGKIPLHLVTIKCCLLNVDPDTDTGRPTSCIRIVALLEAFVDVVLLGWNVAGCAVLLNMPDADEPTSSESCSHVLHSYAAFMFVAGAVVLPMFILYFVCIAYCQR